ncbi:MAG TPA: thioredoxin family protein, partial [Solirubrobacterales bacterium]|nr:thioredoxin family protein [Solirubrobacterales bacterium]
LPSAVVGHYPGSRPGFPKSPANPPDVGQPAPRIHTPTAAEVGGDLSKIDTRIPPDDMEEFDFADVLGKKPVVLVFATPQFCQSRVCGPVVDEEEQVKQSFEDKAAFIHVEIYNENNPAKGVRPQVRAFNLPSEPWTFVIDRHGIIRTRIEGALSVAELENAVREVTG